MTINDTSVCNQFIKYSGASNHMFSERDYTFCSFYLFDNWNTGIQFDFYLLFLQNLKNGWVRRKVQDCSEQTHNQRVHQNTTSAATTEKVNQLSLLHSDKGPQGYRAK